MDGFVNIHNFWETFKNIDTKEFECVCKFLFEEFGTSLACNRFDIGNCIEYAFADMLKATTCFQVENVPNAQRYDVNVQTHGYVSIKYSSSGNIRLHNSLGNNKDTKMKPTFVIFPTCIYFITEDLVQQYNVTLESYLKNTSDALELKRSIFTSLDKKEYPYKIKIDIQVDKGKCKHRQCAEVIYKYVKDTVSQKKVDKITSIITQVNNLTLTDDE
jgi:hypothetical protein